MRTEIIVNLAGGVHLVVAKGEVGSELEVEMRRGRFV